MGTKHLQSRIKQCLLQSELSNCPRRKFGALLVDPIRNVVLMDAYNGYLRDSSAMCGGTDTCARSNADIPSGTHVEIGCVHAEMNLICNCAANGVPTKGGHLLVNGEPCHMCSKLIIQSGISQVTVIEGGYAGSNGLELLEACGVKVDRVEGPKDPRSLC